MTAVYEWHLVTGVSSLQANTHRLYWSNSGLNGNTVVRVIGCVEVKHFLNVPAFPPSFRCPITFGCYFSHNITTPSLLPDYNQDNPDWVTYQQIPLRSGFGVTSAVQSDLVYEGSVSFDVKGQRKLEIDHPLFEVSIGTWGDTSSPPDSYQPDFSVSATIHYLVRHDI